MTTSDAPQPSGRMPRPDAVTNQDARRDDAENPQYARTIRVRLPVPVTWCRQVDSVHPSANNVQGYVGRYVGNAGTQSPVQLRVGAVCVLCTADGHRLLVYVLLPDGLWYRTQRPALQWETGWARLLRDHVRDWVSLSRDQRIIRACSEMTDELTAARLEVPDDIDKQQVLDNAMVHVESIVQGVVGDVTELTADLVMRSFDAWASSVSTQSHQTRGDVINALTDALERENGLIEPEEITIRSLDRLIDILDSEGLLEPGVEMATTNPIRNARRAVVKVTQALDRAERTYVNQLAAIDRAAITEDTAAPAIPANGMQRLARNIRLNRRS